MEDEAVLDLESSFEDDEEHSEDERLLSSLRQSLGPQTDGAFGESDDDGGSGHGPKLKGDKEVEGDDADTRWGSSKAAYYNGEESSEDDQGEFTAGCMCARHGRFTAKEANFNSNL